MPQMKLHGALLGLRSKPYDFVDKVTKERSAGTSRRLFLWDLTATEPVEISIREEQLHLVGDLTEGQLVTLSVEPRANGNRVTYAFESLASVDGTWFQVTGEAPSRKAS